MCRWRALHPFPPSVLVVNDGTNRSATQWAGTNIEIRVSKWYTQANPSGGSGTGAVAGTVRLPLSRRHRPNHCELERWAGGTWKYPRSTASGSTLVFASFGTRFGFAGCPQFDGPGNFQPSAGLLAATPTPASAFQMTGDFTIYMWINPVSRSGRCGPKRSGTKEDWPFFHSTAPVAVSN